MVMVLYFVQQIEDEHSDFGFSNVPRIYKKRVRDQLIVNGNGHLAEEGVKNYIGPRPPLVLEELLAASKAEWEREQAEKNKQNGNS